MTSRLLDRVAPPSHGITSPIYGVVIGIVTRNGGEESKPGQVKVRFPRLSDTYESDWIRIAAPMAGNGRGSYFLPEVDDEVLVAFEQGQLASPYVIGALWNGQDLPPENNEDDKNNRRIIRSRSGQVLCFDDTKGSEKIEIHDKEQKNSIVIDMANNYISISAEKDILIESRDGQVMIKAKGIMISSTSDEIKVEAGSGMHLEAKGGTTAIKGTTVELNC